MQRPYRRKAFLLSPEFPSYGICGSRGSGKSVLLEFIEEWYYKHGYVVCDFFGSIDHENGYWCVPETVAIGRWNELEKGDSNKLIEYLKKRFEIPEEATGFTVQRVDEKTVVCSNAEHSFRIQLKYGNCFAVLTRNPGLPDAKSWKLF